MDADSIQKMGMTASDVTDMISAWSANVKAWRQAIYDAGLFEWFMVYGGQQTAPGWSQTEPNSTCLSFMRKNSGANSPSQNGTMFFGYSRFAHSQAWGPGGSLLSPTQDLAAFLITRGPWAWFVSSHQAHHSDLKHTRTFTRAHAHNSTLMLQCFLLQSAPATMN